MRLERRGQSLFVTVVATVVLTGGGAATAQTTDERTVPPVESPGDRRVVPPPFQPAPLPTPAEQSAPPTPGATTVPPAPGATTVPPAPAVPAPPPTSEARGSHRSSYVEESNGVARPPTTVTPIPIVGTIPAPPPERHRARQPFRTALQAGGGIVDFGESDLRDFTSTGGYWDVRLVLGTRSWFAVEAAYVGALHDVSALGLDENSWLVRNGVEGNLRLNLPIVLRRTVVAPFAFGGLGWSRFRIVNSDFNTSALDDLDDVATVPVGAGLMLGFSGIMFDLRAAYRFTFNDEILTVDDADDHGQLGSWSVGAQLGFEL